MKTKIPSGWNIKKINELGQVYSGSTPSTAIPAYWNGTINWCTPTDVTSLKGYKYLQNTSKKITEQGYKNSGAQKLSPRSVIVCTRATIGDCAINTEPMTTNQGFKSIVPNEKVDYEYLYYAMVFLKPILLRLGNGSTFLEVVKSDFEQIEILIPDNKKEQKKIAEILSTWDRAIETIDKLIDAKTRLKKGLMQKLLTGKVRFKEFKCEKWQHVKLSEICEINYGKSPKGLNSGKYKIYGTGGIVGTASTYLYDKPSVIIGRKGTINNPIYVDAPFYAIDTVFYVSLKQGMLPRWFYYQLRMIDLMLYNEATGVPSLNRETLYKIKINKASVDEQKKVASFLFLLDRELDCLSNSIEIFKKQKKSLMQKLLTGKIRVKT